MATFKLFKMHLRVPFLVLALVEFLICFLSVYVAIYLRFDGTTLYSDQLALYNIHSPVIAAIIFGLTMPITMMAMGLYQSRFRGGVIGVFLRSVIGFSAGAVLLAIMYYIIPSLYLGRGVFAIALLIAFFVVGTIRPLFFYYVDKDVLKVKVLVLGAGRIAASIDSRLRRKVDRRGFRISGYLPIREDESTQVNPNKLLRIDCKLLEYCQANEIDEIIVAPDERRNGLPLEQLLECKLHGIQIIDILSFFEREQGKLPLDIMRPDWLIYSDGFDQGVLRDLNKRLFDIVVSLLILLPSLPYFYLRG